MGSAGCGDGVNGIGSQDGFPSYRCRKTFHVDRADASVNHPKCPQLAKVGELRCASYSSCSFAGFTRARRPDGSAFFFCWSR